MSTQTAINYWCYVCETKTTSFSSITQCTTCHQDAIQLIEDENLNAQPQNFQVYQIQNQQPPIPIPPPANNATMTLITLNDQPNQNNQGALNQNFNELRISFFTGDFSHGGNSPMNIPMMGQINAFADFGGNILSDLLNNLLRSQNGLTPATPQQISQLQRVQRVKECSICQQIEQNEEGPAHQGFKLACNHTFHRECLSPWLQKTNTCPCCRVALP